MRAKEILADMEDKLKILVDNYKKLESTRDDLIGELKRLGSDTLDRVERARNNALQFDADQHLNQVRREVKKAIFPNAEFKAVVAEETTQEKKGTEEPQPVMVEAQPRKVQKSFFDEIA